MLSASLLATEVFAGNGESIFAFLKLGPSARAAAMGDGFVALADDSSANYYNPAGLTRVKEMELGFTHMEYLEQISYEYLSMAKPITERSTLGFQLIYLNYGKMDLVKEDASGYLDSTNYGSFSSFDSCVSLSYANRIKDSLSLGVTAKYITEEIHTTKVSGMAADIGAQYQFQFIALTYGLNIQNIGSKVGGDKLPTAIKTGFNMVFDTFKRGDLNTVLDANVPMDGSDDIKYNLGLEYSVIKHITVRAGYRVGYDLDSYTAGLSFNLLDTNSLSMKLDYAFAPYEDFDTVHRISMRAGLGGGK